MRNLQPVSFAAAALASAFLTMGAAGAATPERAPSKGSERNNAFAADLYTRLAGQEGNLFFSPASIRIALAMAWAGANGPTATEMAKVLHLEHDAGDLGGFLRTLNADGEKGGYDLSIANAFWALKGYPFMPDYLKRVESEYHGHLGELDFLSNSDGSRGVINDWVAQQTHDRIKDLLPQGTITPDTRLVLTNAIYFKGKWDLPFLPGQTNDDEFTTSGGEKVSKPFMHQKNHFRYAEDDQVQVLELIYGKRDLAMRIFLPRSADGLKAFEAQLSAERLTGLAGKLQREEVNVWLPRFTAEQQFSLADVLQAMGMHSAFDPAAADFKGMTSAERFFISAVVHKAFVKVDEEGTEAAAATGLIMKSAAMIRSGEPKTFRADHPFVFQIVHEKTGAVLFAGRVVKP